MRNVGDMDADSIISISQVLERQGIIEILRIIGVDSQGGNTA